ncbi:MAG: glycosyl transferase, partial [Chlamydiae bacterium CG10_big_fil_rev_8_21_14_0_10_35_9]
MKLALVNDWLMSGVGGSEKVLQAICEIFNPPLFTLVSDPKNLQDTFFEKVEIHNSFVQKLPFSKKKYRNYLPFFPMAIEQFNLSTYDVVLSCSHSVAKGVLTNSEQLHICYCYTPIRYAWDLYYQYLRESKLERGLKAKLAKFFLHYVRMWDIQSASRVDEYVAISHFIAKRIQKIYGKTASV